MSPTHEDLPHATTKPLSAESWRWAELLRAGVADKYAEKLAKCNGDLHKMLETKAAGCSDTKLLKIFL